MGINSAFKGLMTTAVTSRQSDSNINS